VGTSVTVGHTKRRGTTRQGRKLAPPSTRGLGHGAFVDRGKVAHEPGWKGGTGKDSEKYACNGRGELLVVNRRIAEGGNAVVWVESDQREHVTQKGGRTRLGGPHDSEGSCVEKKVQKGGAECEQTR